MLDACQHELARSCPAVRKQHGPFDGVLVLVDANERQRLAEGGRWNRPEDQTATGLRHRRAEVVDVGGEGLVGIEQARFPQDEWSIPGVPAGVLHVGGELIEGDAVARLEDDLGVEGERLGLSPGHRRSRRG